MRNGLELVHFQITRNCNLRCWFCGQWGKQGFFAADSGKALNMDGWLRIAGELAQLPQKPSIILWGGEPLVCPFFDELAQKLHGMGFSLGMVTNGTLLDRHLDTCRRCFRQIYVSVDGEQETHDAIRGQGVFQKVKENLALLRGGNARISINTVLTPALMERLPQTLDAFAALQPDEVILQELIALTAEEIRDYKTWLEREFSQQAREIDGWEGECHPDAQRGAKIAQVLAGRQDAFRVVYKPHGQACGRNCTSALHHAHVTWKGNVTFCTDFYDFSAGNIHDAPLLDIFENETSRHFRREIEKGSCATCGHCSWRNSSGFRL